MIVISFTKLRRENFAKDDILSYDFTFVLAGNPNVGKSTLFNELTGLSQHTGNWAGKTVSLAYGSCKYMDKTSKIVDLPGSYSLLYDSPEEMITDEYILSGNYDCVIIVADATALERNLMLAIQILSRTNRAVLCLNLIDEAQKQGINIDTDELSIRLGIPVVETSARNKRGIGELLKTATEVACGDIRTFNVDCISTLQNDTYDYESQTEKVAKLSRDITAASVGSKGSVYTTRDRKLDSVFTSKITGIPIMILVFAVIFWLTAFGANYPSEWLSITLSFVRDRINNFFDYIHLNNTLQSFLMDGIYTTVSWVVSVMLPPALIFFPLFAILEDVGYLPRIAFNLDRYFKRAGANGKQALTMLMGFGCNACGVMGCRIINSPRERLIAIVTNSFVPCNGRLPTLIAIISIFFAASFSGFKKSLITTGILLMLLFLVVLVTLFVSFVLSKTLLKGQSSSFILELPPYRKPQFIKVIILSIKEKVLYVLSRAVIVAIPAGAIIWLLSNIEINGQVILLYVTDFLNPLGQTLGVDGVILAAFVLGFPANEIVIPIILMAYLSNGTLTDYSSLSQLGGLLSENGWTIITAVCTAVLCLLHYPCSTTCFAIKRETKSTFWTIISILTPLVMGLALCLIINCVYLFFIR